MADVVIIVVAIGGFFALCAAFVAGCDLIVRSDEEPAPAAAPEVPR